ncbi:MAG: M3 family metallopeptidase [Candidatus Thorarchaeota archaeon]
MTEKDIAWDLSEIFSGYDDPKISENMDALLKDADEIVKEYKGKINTTNFSAQNLHNLLEKYESILVGQQDLEVFCWDLFNANTLIPENKELLNKYQNFKTSLEKKLAFLELEIGKLVNNNPHLVEREVLNNYQHYLEKIKAKSPYKLSETEEQIILEKDESGVIAWEQLKDSWMSSRKFKVIVEGKEKMITISDFVPLLFHPDRNTRISVIKAVCGSLGKEEEIYSSALRYICSDWVKIVNRRHYDNPIHQSLLDNDTTQHIIDSLIKTIEDSIGIYQKFLKIKEKLLNLPKLNGADLWAFLPFEKRYTWEEAKELIVRVYAKFDEIFGEYANDMFIRNHIDAGTREGKTGGIYCYPWYKGKSAFILTSFKGLVSELFFVTHEMGHGIHSYLSSREQTFLNYIPGMAVAETASKFGELLLTDYLLNTIKAKNERISLLTNQINFASYIFRYSAKFRFEQNLYNAINKGEFLDGQTISQYWCAARDNVYRDSVEWFDEMKWIWITTPHYFLPNFRFYNYPYAYAQLFVYALYQTFKDDGREFVPKFKKLLSAGSSLSPEELGKIVDLDITKPDFWQLGMKQYEEFVDQLEELTK